MDPAVSGRGTRMVRRWLLGSAHAHHALYCLDGLRARSARLRFTHHHARPHRDQARRSDGQGQHQYAFSVLRGSGPIPSLA
jgi:hypothetical protein